LNSKTKFFAPANLRASVEDSEYKKLVQFYMDQKYTLRYSGGLVPDFYHALIKGSGIFISPVTKKSPAKLRMVYEVSALAMIALWAGGGAVDGIGADLAPQVVEEYDARSGLIIGSLEEVERFRATRNKK
jgi:sedoheptulose-bisphosphatase